MQNYVEQSYPKVLGWNRPGPIYISSTIDPRLLGYEIKEGDFWYDPKNYKLGQAVIFHGGKWVTASDYRSKKKPEPQPTEQSKRKFRLNE